MATNYQNILDQFTNVANDTLSASSPEDFAAVANSTMDAAAGPMPAPTPMEQLTEAARRNKAYLDQITNGGFDSGYRASVAESKGITGALGSEVEQDLATMTPTQLEVKYGPHYANILTDIRANGGEQFRQDTTARRTGIQALGDTTNELVTAPVTTTAGIVGLGFDLTGQGAGAVTSVLDHAINGKTTAFGRAGDRAREFGQNMGLTMARGVDGATEGARSHESDALAAHRKANGVFSEILSEDSARQRDAAISGGDSALRANLRKVGRDFLNGITTETNDGTVFSADAGNAIGSLLGVGPVTKGIRKAAEAVVEPLLKAGIRTGAIDAATVIPDKLIKLGDHALTSASVGTMEAGGAYQQTASQILNTPQSQLEKSPVYQQLVASGMAPEQARNELASQAGRIAAEIAGPTGAAAGVLVSGFENKVVSAFLKGDTSLLKSMGAETLEEGIQGASGQFAQNVGIQQTSNPNQDLTDQVGQQSAIGAIHGPGAVLATGGPGAAARGAIKGTKAAVEVAKDVGGAAVDVGKAIGKVALAPLAARGQRVSDLLNAATSAASNLTQPVANAPAPVAIDPMDASPVPDQSAVPNDVVDSTAAPVDNSVDVGQPTQTSNEPVDPVAHAQALTDAYLAMDKSPANEEARAAAWTELQNARHDAGLPLKGDYTTTEDQAPVQQEASPTPEKFSLGEDTSNTPDIRDTAALWSKIEQGSVTQSDIDSSGLPGWAVEQAISARATGEVNDFGEFNDFIKQRTAGLNEAQAVSQDVVNKAVQTASTNPDKVDPNLNDQILYHADQGNIDLSHEQAAALKTSADLTRAQQEYAQEADRLGSKADVVSGEILDGEGNSAPSAKEHVRGIVQAMNAGRTGEAKSLLDDFKQFAQLMQNKVGALNTHYEKGDGTAQTGVTYKNLIGSLGRRHWIDSNRKLSVNPAHPNSVRFAQQVANEASILGKTVNSLIAAYPQLGLSPLELTPLHKNLQGNINEVVSKSASKSSNTTTSTTEPATTGQPKGGDQSAEVKAKSEAKAEPKPAAKTAEKPTTTKPVDEKTARKERFRQVQEKLKTTERGKLQTIETYPGTKSKIEQGLHHFAYAPTDGGPIVRGKYTVDGDTIENLDIGDTSNPSDLGAGEIRNLFRQLHSAHPEVKFVQALRMTGARKNAGQGPQEIWGKIDAKGISITRSDPRVAEQTQQESTPETKPQAEQSPAVETKQEASPAEKAAPTPAEADGGAETAQPVEQQPVEQSIDKAIDEPAAKPSDLKAAYPDLLGSKEGSSFTNWFHNAFKLPKTATSRLFGHTAPFVAIRDALRSNEALAEFIGKATRHTLNGKLVNAYRSVMKSGVDIAKTMQANLQVSLKDEYKGHKKLDLLVNQTVLKSSDGTADVKLNETLEGRAYNITEVHDGKVAYNTDLLAGAVLAGMQWLLTATRGQQRIDAETVGKLIGMPEGTFPEELVDEFNQGISETVIKRAIAQQITRFWGVQSRNDVDQAFSDGIAESIAAEVMTAMIENKLLTLHKVTVTAEEHGIADKKIEFNLYEPKLFKDTLAYPTAIEDAVMVDPEGTHIGTAPPNVEKTVLNNPGLENTPRAKTALKHENHTPYRLHLPFIGLVAALKMDRILDLLGEGDLRKRELNVNTRRSLEGKNLTLRSAVQSLLGLHEEVSNRAETEEKNVSEMEVFYPHNMTSVGRMQQIGKDTPQSSKLVRHGVLPTFATMDLTDPKSMSKFLLALAQSLGKKVHNQSRATSEEEALKALDGDLKPAVDVLRTIVDDNGSSEISDAQYKVLKDAFGGKTDPASLFAAMEYARYLNAKEAGTDNKFETPIYVEADGLTNGPVMSMMIALAGRFTPNWLHNMAKGGVFFHDPKLTTNDYRQKDDVDLYEKTANLFKQKLGALRHMLSGNKAAITQMDHLTHLIQTFLPKQLFKNEKGELQFGRDITKNPLTITLYGAGEEGIGNNVANALMGAIYQAISDGLEKRAANSELTMAEAMFGDKSVSREDAQQKMDQFLSSMSALTESYMYEKDGKLRLYKSIEGDRSFDAKQFKLNREEFKNLSSNILHLFVKPMREAIRDTVGPELMNSLTLLRKATQVQSIFAHFEYLNEIRKRLKGKTNTVFLSRDEQQDVRLGMGALDSVIRTSTGQTFYPAGSTRGDITGISPKTGKRAMREFGRGLDGAHRTAGYVYAPDDAGVGGIPTMIIGMGDGLMQMLHATMANAVDKALRVFDGINLSLDQAELGSQQINKAAFLAMMSNPLREIQKGYDAFMEAATLTVTDEDQIRMLSRALFDTKEEAEMATPAQIKQALLNLQASLKLAANQIDARHNVIRKLNISIDQMAAVGSPHFHEGGINLSGLSSQQMSDTMNLMLDQQLSTMGEGQQSQELADSFERAGSMRNGGITVITHNMLKRMLPRLDVHPDQLAVLRDIVGSLVTKQYEIVTGALSSLRAYAEHNGGQQLPAEGPDGSKINGMIAFGDKKIYIANKSSETLVHELIHAATFEKIVAFYSGNTKGLSEVESEAIVRIEHLMQQFLGLENVPVVAKQAFDNAKAAIEGALQNQKLTPEMRQTTALNEFMAWAQSNETLINLLKSTKVENPLVKLAKAVVAQIKQLVWGTRRAPKVADDMHSNLRFNTSILVNSGVSVSDLIGDAVAFHSEAFGSSEHLDTVKETIENKIISYLSDDVGRDVREDYHRQVEFDEAGMLATRVSNVFSSQFTMTPDEKLTFELVVTILGTQAKLDPNSLTEVQSLFSHVTKNLRYTDFLANPEQATDREEYYARQKYDAVVGNLTTSKDLNGRSTLLSAFLALSITNPEFRAVLAKLDVPELKLAKWDSLDNILNNTGMLMMDKLGALMSGADRKSANVAAAMQTLTDRIILNAQQRQSRIMDIINGPERFIDSVNSTLVKGVRTGVETLHDKLDGLKTAEDGKLKEGAIEFTKAVTSLLHEEKASALKMGLMSQLNKSKVGIGLHEIINDFVGRTEENAPVIDLIKRIRSRVQQVRQQFRENLPVELKNRFSRKLTKEEWDHLFHALGKTDLAALASTMTEAEMLNLIKDQRQLRTKIAELEEQVSSLDADARNKIEEKAKQLAEFMNNGDVAVFNGNATRNAYAIANLFGEVRPGSRTATDPLIEAVDQLTTLYALQGLSNERREAVSQLVEHEADGMNFLMAYMIGQRHDEQAKAKADLRAYANHYKGYIPAENKNGDSLFVAVDGSEEAKRLIDMGFTRVADYVGSQAERATDRKGYYFAPAPIKAPHRQGLFQNVRKTASGVDPFTGFTNSMSTAGRITELQEVRRLTRLMHSRNQGSEALLPIYDTTGYIIAFERAVHPDQEARITRETNLSEAIGIWRGRQAEEISSDYFNRAVIEKIKSIWDRDQLLRRDEFVNLLDPELKDPIYKDSVSLLTAQTIRDAEAVFGKGELWVRRDMILDVIGARQASIGDAWTGLSRWSPGTQELVRKSLMGVFGKDAYIKATKAEKILQDVVTDLKVTIVVKSVIVPTANLTANIIQLISRGVPVARIATGMPRKTAEIDAYVKSRVRQIQLEAELRAASQDVAAQARIKTEIQSIKDANKRLSIWPLIEAGEFSAISDTTVTHEEFLLSEGRLSEYIEGVAKRMPKPLLQAARYGIITKDTPLFKALQRSVEYGDFLGKALLYEHLTEKKGKSVKAALADISEEFVNYDRLAGRNRQYLESIGLIWFWNFKIRSMKIAGNILRNNPVQALFALSLPSISGLTFPGSPITDNWLSMWWNNRLGWSIGPGMGFEAHHLNPWVNAFY